MAATKVLVVDDDPDFRHSTTRLLAGHGYAGLEAGGSVEARQVLDREGDVAVVLCDIRMPEVSGLELLGELTADFPDLVVIMMTGVDDPATAEVAFAAGAYGYVVKPFELNELLISLTGALRRAELEAAQQRHVRSLEQTIVRTRTLGTVLDELSSSTGTAFGADREVIERLTRAVSVRDEQDGRHLERMSSYAVALAAASGFDALPLEDLRVASALHDVGKIGVPDAILLKASPLSDDERSAVERHTQIGFQLLAGSDSDLLSAAAEIALTHHEWWDGGGYPRGLIGTEIPEAARIAAIADVFDTLTSWRSYHAAVSFEAAIEVLEGQRGRQFEPRLLDAFLTCVPELTAIRAGCPDRSSSEQPVLVHVVEAQRDVADRLVLRLEQLPGLTVVGRSASVAAAVLAVLAYEPDVVLMGIELPDGDGPHATEQIKALRPDVKVLMLVEETDAPAKVRAIAAGCSGFFDKDGSADDLRDAILATDDGEAVTSTSELGPLLRELRPTRRGLGADLTPREVEILVLMAEGLVNKQVALRLGVQLNTVRNHTTKILAKLQAHSKLEAVATAAREGILSYPSGDAGSMHGDAAARTPAPR